MNHNLSPIESFEPQPTQSMDFFHAFKPAPLQEGASFIHPSNESALQLENQLLQNQIKTLSHLLLQYQFTNQKVLETLHENLLLQDSITTLDLKINCLSEAAEIQSLEICRRDNMIADFKKDVGDHKKRLRVLSDAYEENGYPECKFCFKHPPMLMKCNNHGKNKQIVGCVYCAVKKCPLCRSRSIEEVSIQPESKKIKKMSKKTEKKKLKNKN